MPENLYSSSKAINAETQSYPWPHKALLALLIILGSLIMLSSAAVFDTARDVYYAWQIASGSGYPMEGPVFSGILHCGPLWFYILSLPLFFTSSWAVLSMWVGLLTGLKYLLAYACGVRLGNRQLGLLWACLLALPNWTAVLYLIFSHTNLVETAMLFGFYCLIRWQAGETRWFIGLCLAVSLAFHAHPTTLAFGIALTPLVIWQLIQKKLAWSVLLTAIVVAVLPWIPYLISQHSQAWPDFRTSTEYAASLDYMQNFLGVLSIARGTFIDSPFLMLKGFLGLEGLALGLASAVLYGVFVVGIGLAFHNAWRQHDWRLPVALLIQIATSLVLIAMIRPITLYYMVLLLYPAWCGLAALGWSQFGEPWKTRISYSASAMALLTLGGFAVANYSESKTGHALLPATSLVNVRRFAPMDFTDGVVFPAWARTDLAKFICAHGQEVNFHGMASLILEQSFALEARMRCPNQKIYVGGTGPGPHYLGVNQVDATFLGLVGTPRVGPLHFIKPQRVFGPAEPLAVPIGDEYPPRQPMWGEHHLLQHQFETTAEEMLVINNLYQFWMPREITVLQNGQPAVPILQTTLQEYYACENCQPGENANWSVTISAPHPEFVEVVVFNPLTDSDELSP
ncbi:MAG: hypothetical protein SH820_07910 [Xanthomonadales bacterium]|nr:hypothetical protein [Xanthomonadales bacterium]